MRIRIAKYMVVLLGVIFLKDVLMLDHNQWYTLEMSEQLNDPCEKNEQKEERIEQEVDEFIHELLNGTKHLIDFRLMKGDHLNIVSNHIIEIESPPPEECFNS